MKAITKITEETQTMTRTTLITLLLTVVAFLVPADGRAQDQKWTAGPMTLCENEAFVTTMFNPNEYAAEVTARLFDYELFHGCASRAGHGRSGGILHGM